MKVYKTIIFLLLFIRTAFFDAELVAKTFLGLVSVDQLQAILMQSPQTVISLATEKLYILLLYVI